MSPHRRTVVHVLGSFEVGGGEKVALDLAARQLALGHRVLALSLAPGVEGPLAPEFRRVGAGVNCVERWGPRVDPTLPLRLALAFRRLRVGLVHTHNPQSLVYAAPAARLLGLPVVHTKHGFDPASARAVLLRRATGRLLHALVAVSDETAAEARARGDCPAARIEVILNGVDVEAFRPQPALRDEVRQELGIPPTAFVIGTVGRMNAVKNQPLLVRAAAPLLNHGHAHLLLVGDGPHRPAVEAATLALADARQVHLLGRRLDVARLLNGLDLFVLPSDHEGLPLVLLEAMATGLPVVATTVGGIPEVVRDGKTGFLVSPGAEEALRERLCWARDNRDALGVMGLRGREVAFDSYSLERTVQRYSDLYARVATAARSSRSSSESHPRHLA